MRGLRKIEYALLAAGVLLLLVYAAVRFQQRLSSQEGLRLFDERRAEVIQQDPSRSLSAGDPEAVDFSLWSEKRVRGYRRMVASMKESPLAVVEIPKLATRVPVYEGTEEPALNRGAGWIIGTSRPGENGNIGIAGHRDGFFRKLREISPGDRIELATMRETAVYVVDQIEIVAPNDVSVLARRTAPSLTLVTCYPFYFSGDAPQRYIVHAALKQRENQNQRGSVTPQTARANPREGDQGK